MAETTIGVRDETKEKLREEKEDGETFDGVILRLLGEHNRLTEVRVREITREEIRSLSR